MYLLGLGTAPFLDPPEGFHAAIAESVRQSGDWITLRLDGVRYFDKPPLLYWLMALSFAVGGPSEAAARLWPAAAAIGVAAVTGWIGTMLSGPRVGLLAGLLVAVNIGTFVFGREVKPDVVFVFFMLLAFAGFIVAYRGRGRWGLALFYASLGLAALTKDFLGAAAPLGVVVAFLWITRERPYGVWAPWWGILLLIAIALPWYAAAELRSRGLLWYTVVDNHVLNFARQRVFPDEDVPLGSLQFLGVTLVAFLPWVLAAPWALARALRPPWPDAEARLWGLLALWSVLLVGFFTLSPQPGAVAPRILIGPIVLVSALIAAVLALGALGRLPAPTGVLESVDVPARNLGARGQAAAWPPMELLRPIMMKGALVFGLAAVALAVAAWRRLPALGIGVALAAMIAFLPMVGEGMALFARGRSARPIVEALTRRLGPGDVVVHEGPLEDTGSLLLTVTRPVHVVRGLQSNLAFGATFPEARDVFWSESRLQEAWAARRRCFLVSTIDPQHSVERSLTPLHLVAEGGGRWLYSNRAD
ncbi:MAG: phospholipid carrier-dependent glycosyltransferase [Candidatus Rokuibacteriota bacterium]|nr:MAG: phospholipid carrier-dependent glycosyltransferase [Candidatus Rokubacteria bacterium]